MRLYPKMLNGAHKNLSNPLPNCVSYSGDRTLEVVSKSQSLKPVLNSFLFFSGNIQGIGQDAFQQALCHGAAAYIVGTDE